jgi:hypothetical protein
VKIGFDDLFTGRGGESLGYSPRAEALSGTDVEIGGFLVPLHDEPVRFALVDTPGACPDCAPVPIATVHLPGFRAGAAPEPAQPVRLRGRLSYGFAIAADGYASFLRLEDARVATGFAQAARGG